MSDTPENQGAETEKGFGTGLRAQLQRRREGETGHRSRRRARRTSSCASS